MDLFGIRRLFFLALDLNSDTDLPQAADSHRAWPIGVGKKCCQLCWVLHEAFNDQRGESGEFVVPGTHGTFYPWYPPPGLPLHILTSLHEALLQESKTMGLTHSRQSSASSVTSFDIGSIPMK